MLNTLEKELSTYKLPVGDTVSLENFNHNPVIKNITKLLDQHCIDYKLLDRRSFYNNINKKYESI